MAQQAQARLAIDFWEQTNKGKKGKKAVMINNRIRFYERIITEIRTSARARYLNKLKSTPEISVQLVRGLSASGFSLYNHWEGQWLTKPIKVCTLTEAQDWLNRIGGK